MALRAPQVQSAASGPSGATAPLILRVQLGETFYIGSHEAVLFNPIDIQAEDSTTPSRMRRV